MAINAEEDSDKSIMTRLYDVRDFVTHGDVEERGRILENLTNTVIATIAPNTWKDNGGTLGSMAEFSGRLLVTQTWSNHELVAAELDALRKSGGSFIATRIIGER